MSGNAALAADYFFLRPLIQARLAELVPDLAPAGGVQGVEDLAQAVDRNIQALTAFVLWEGDLFETGDQGRAGAGKSQAMRQQWSVLLGVRNADQQARDARNGAAGPVLSSVHKALAGWSPEGAFRPFVRVQGRRPIYQPNVALYPLTFEIAFNL